MWNYELFIFASFRPIAELSSSLFYENELRCANDTVAGAQLANLACNDAEYLSTFPSSLLYEY